MNQSGHSSFGKSVRRAFSLVEILVTVALLSVIILGLVAMFNQTRRAFTSSITQVDVLEAGRSAADLIAREVEQMAAANSTLVTNFFVQTTSAGSLQQTLVDPNDRQTNTLQDLFFLTRLNQTWTGIGYRVFPNDANGNLGTLYRYSGNNIVASNGPLLALQWSNFYSASVPGTNFTRIMDGVIDFHINAYDANGNLFKIKTSGPTTTTNYLNDLSADYYYAFSGTNLPAFIEVELGVLEDRTLARYQALSNNFNVSVTYLINHPGQEHIFRQRIPIRNVNSAGYQ